MPGFVKARLNDIESVRACHELGLLVNAPRPSCLRLMPRLNSTPAEIEEGLERLAAGLTAQL